MDNCLNKVINRHYEIDIINQFLLNKPRQCLYVYGLSGVGKSFIINKVINDLNYNVLSIYKYTFSQLLSFANYNNNKYVIVIDSIDFLIDTSELVKLIKLNKFPIPIICVSNTKFNKKKKEIFNLSQKLLINPPTPIQIKEINSILMPNISINISDLRKIKQLYLLYNQNITDIPNQIIHNDNELLTITQFIFNNNLSYSYFLSNYNDNKDNIICMNWHENIIDLLNDKDIDLYISFLNNLCFMNYIDKFILKKQISIINDISFLIKTGYNNFILHNNRELKQVSNIRNTKISTKFTTENNNFNFLLKCCSNLLIDKNTLFNIVANNKSHELINKVDFKRLKRFINQ
jgi:hypothetical protein